jgi:hypothetical protein
MSTLKEIVADYLKANKDKKFKARTIAEWIAKAPEHTEMSGAKRLGFTSDKELENQFVNEISSQRPALQRDYPQIRVTGGRPREYYWTEKTDEEEVAEAEATGLPGTEESDSQKFKEHDLYPLLRTYLWSVEGIASMRINEKAASKQRGPGGNRWLFPDLVGIRDLTTTWNDQIKHVAPYYAASQTDLWSFEVKLLLNRSNVRESFFQTLSNSSWANFAYLVAAEIAGDGAMEELRMLCALHGVGLMELETADPTESRILIPARQRLEVDWPSCDRLLKESADFFTFIEKVTERYQTKKLKANDWNLADDNPTQ